MQLKERSSRILIVDDNKELVDSLKLLLEYEGFSTTCAFNGIEALTTLESTSIDLVLLDIMMPGLNGISTLMKLREQFKIPVILLSAKTEESDKVSGLTIGADDYVEKPYSNSELVARIKAQLRRYSLWGGSKPEQKEHRIVNGGLILEEDSKTLLVDGEAAKLTATEYKIISFLMNHIGYVYSATELYEHIWEEDAVFSVENTVMVHIRRIREKIEYDPKNPKYLKVVWGIGYKIEKIK